MDSSPAGFAVPKAIANALIWDSRAPYATYLRHHQHLNRFFRISRCAYALSRDAAARQPQDAAVSCLLPPGPRRRRDAASFDFAGLERCGCRKVLEFTASFDGLEDTLHRAVLVQEVSLFEAYVACWAANMLLAAAETGRLNQLRWLPAVVDPIFHDGRCPQGGTIALLRSFPEAERRLRAEVPRKMDEEMSVGIRELPRRQGDVLSLMEAWRFLRNHIVHGDAPVTAPLVQSITPIWIELQHRNFEGLPSLSVGSRLRLTPNLVVAGLSVFGVFARVLWSHLLKYSAERRGHTNAPGPYLGPRRPGEMPPDPPLLLPGEERLVSLIREIAAEEKRIIRAAHDQRQQSTPA